MASRGDSQELTAPSVAVPNSDGNVPEQPLAGVNDDEILQSLIDGIRNMQGVGGPAGDFADGHDPTPEENERIAALFAQHPSFARLYNDAVASAMNMGGADMTGANAVPTDAQLAAMAGLSSSVHQHHGVPPGGFPNASYWHDVYKNRDQYGPPPPHGGYYPDDDEDDWYSTGSVITSDDDDDDDLREMTREDFVNERRAAWRNRWIALGHSPFQSPEDEEDDEDFYESEGDVESSYLDVPGLEASGDSDDDKAE